MAEFLFDASAIQRRLIVNRPIHSGTIYDRVVEYSGRFFKVQIKCVSKYDKDGAIIAVLKRSNHKLYPIELVDVFAVYFIPEDCWYIFSNKGQKSLYVNKNKYIEYKNNWDVFYETV